MRIHLLCTLFLLVVVLVGCDSAGDAGSVDSTVVSLSLAETDVTLSGLGTTHQLTAQPRNSINGLVQGAALTWTSDDTDIATVDDEGLVTAVAYGTATITVASGGLSAAAAVRVVPVVPDRVPATTPVAFVGAHVLPMDAERIEADQTVLVRNGVIEAVGDAGAVQVPTDAEVIDASGQYLMPGLTDMHTHIKLGSLDDSENSMLLYVANGITTVLNMGDYNRDILRIRDRVRAGQVLGPTIFAGQFVRPAVLDSGLPGFTDVNTPQEGVAAVQDAVARGYDFMKVYNSLTTETYDAVVAEARAHDVPVIGHAVREPGLPYIMNNGLEMVAHADEFFQSYFNSTFASSRLPEAASATAASGAYLTASLAVYDVLREILLEKLNGGTGLNVIQRLDGIEYLDATRKGPAWTSYLNNFFPNGTDWGPRVRFLQDITAAMHAAGVPLLVGTDSPVIPGVVPGFSIHDELRLMEDAGLPTFDVLLAATRNAGDFINEHVTGSEPFGQVAVGHRADLLLLSADPVEDLEHLKARVGVMVDGQWLSEVHLQARLETQRN